MLEGLEISLCVVWLHSIEFLGHGDYPILAIQTLQLLLTKILELYYLVIRPHTLRHSLLQTLKLIQCRPINCYVVIYFVVKYLVDIIIISCQAAKPTVIFALPSSVVLVKISGKDPTNACVFAGSVAITKLSDINNTLK